MSDAPMYEAMREFIRAQVALEVTKASIEMRGALVRSVPQIEVREGPAGKDGIDGTDGVNGTDGRDGKDAELPDIEAMVERAVAALPPPKDGKDGAYGLDGKNADPAEVERLVTEHVTRAVLALPVPQNGKDADLSALPEMVAAEVTRATSSLPSMVNEVATRVIATLPRPKDGEPGENGIATREELEEIVEARFADVQVRTLADAFKGVYRSGESYDRGQLAVLDGSLFLALADTAESPTTSPSWQMITKRGRDGRDRK